MSGGFSRPAWRLLLLAVFALFALSGCSLLWGPQQAPIVDATVMPVEPASAPVAASAPEPAETEAAEPEQPKKPKKPVVKPRKVEPPPPVATPAPPPPAPPPLIVLRTIERSEARALLDSEVQKPDGKVVGRAVDLIADASGKPREIVVNLQGFLGVGDRKVNFPWNAFRFTPTAKTAPITLNATATPTPAAKSAAVQLPLIDTDVERSNGAKVGRVIDVLIDANAQPQAVVLDVNGMVSTERRTIAANWSALRFVTKDKELHPLIDLSDAQINATPPYASDKPIRAVSPAPPPAPAPAPASAPAPATAASAAPATVTAGSNTRAAR
ncbi:MULTISPECIES: PRC-barrel domain-containing protein [Paraburkholderia]|uniref:PRC-barrel domain-containing protein n=1 Tax=Paraburkholderia madseniana TaxID=2599607 RepID=A0AAP5BNB7_9BURK|nr:MULTISPECIES: PRC-barrel domain-containing protein [Paraburkholderia]MCX4151694.1 PRC-barrel domain-containing protein [Paraburkholderia madseniana]MDN7154622.1 PRC-barrel domain-containing protein [Paraburkholderia sp. WS6]MDQ6413505.1 PRC-barrel domain-containing protein [Paraburkholderia madseniana]